MQREAKGDSKKGQIYLLFEEIEIKVGRRIEFRGPGRPGK